MQNKIHLIRFFDDDHVRYYNIEITPTLFGEVLFERVYGNIRYKRPTRVLREYFEDIQVAQKLFNRMLKDKIRKGYIERFGQWM